MILSLSAELWVIVQIGLDLLLIVLFVYMIRQMRGSTRSVSGQNAVEVTRPVETVLEEAKVVAAEFEKQLEEKRKIVQRLNEQLDHRIINLNLLLKQSQGAEVSSEDGNVMKKKLSRDSYELQREILSLSEKGLPSTEIAETLGMVEGEVNLVLDLKRKFREMEAP